MNSGQDIFRDKRSSGLNQRPLRIVHPETGVLEETTRRMSLPQNPVAHVTTGGQLLSCDGTTLVIE